MRDSDSDDDEKEIEILINVPSKVVASPVSIDADHYIRHCIRAGPADNMGRFKFAMNLRQQVEEAHFTKLSFDGIARFLSSTSSPNYQLSVYAGNDMISFDITENRQSACLWDYPDCQIQQNKLYATTTQTTKLSALTRHIQKILSTMCATGVYNTPMSYRMTESLIILTISIKPCHDFFLDLSTISVRIPSKTLPDGRPGRLQTMPVLQTLSITTTELELGFNRYFDGGAVKRSRED